MFLSYRHYSPEYFFRVPLSSEGSVSDLKLPKRHMKWGLLGKKRQVARSKKKKVNGTPARSRPKGGDPKRGTVAPA